MGLETSTVYFVSAKKCSLSEGVTSIFVYGGISSLVAIAVGTVVITQFNFSFFSKASQLSFFLALLTIPATLCAASLILLLTSIHEFRWFAILSIADAAFLLIFTILFVMLGQSGVNGALIAVIFQGLMSTSLALLFLRRRYHIHLVKPAIRLLWDMFHYGARFHVGKASNFANINMGTIIAAIFLTKEDVGFFAVASQTIARTMIIPDTLTTVLFPKVASERDNMDKDISRLTRLTGGITIVFLVFLSLLAKPFVLIIFSPSFLPAVPLIQILAIGIAVRSISKIFEPYLLGVGHPGRVSVSSIVTLIANFVLAWFFLSLWGLTGVAIGTTVAYFFGAYVLLLGFMKHSGLHFVDIFRFKQSDFDFILGRSKINRGIFPLK